MAPRPPSTGVIAFEPQPGPADFIRRGLGGRVRVEQVALSDGEGEVVLRVPRDRMQDGRATIEPGNALESLDADRDRRPASPPRRLRPAARRLRQGRRRGPRTRRPRRRPRTPRSRPADPLIEAEDRHRPGAVESVAAFLAGLGYKRRLSPRRRPRPPRPDRRRRTRRRCRRGRRGQQLRLRAPGCEALRRARRLDPAALRTARPSQGLEDEVLPEEAVVGAGQRDLEVRRPVAVHVALERQPRRRALHSAARPRSAEGRAAPPGEGVVAAARDRVDLRDVDRVVEPSEVAGWCLARRPCCSATAR